MRGSTRKRGSTWTALWDHHDPATGARRQKSKGGFRTQREAQTHLATVITSVAQGGYVEPSKQQLGAFLLEEWLPAIGGTVRPLTRERYEKIVSLYVAKRDIGAIPLRALSGGHLTALYSELERDGLSIGTRRLTHSVLRHALGDAVRWGKLVRNPAMAAVPPAKARSRVQSWSARELRRFLAHVEDDRLFALWRLAATTGMRRGELVGLTWRCLDIDCSRLRVERQLLLTRDGLVFAPPKSRRSERTVALDADTIKALREHRRVQELERDLAGSAYEDHDLVFCNELGGTIHPDTLSARFTKHRNDADIPSGSIHVLRHTAATLALTATPPVPLHVVAGRLGDDPRTLLGTYAHLLPHSDAQAAEAVAAILADKALTNAEAAAPQPAV
jgi:integrase